MRTLLYTLLFIAAMSCKDDDEVQMGCQTGIPKGGTTRVYMRCCTEKEHQAGSNTSEGGTTDFTLYNSVQWTSTKNCNDCR